MSKSKAAEVSEIKAPAPPEAPARAKLPPPAGVEPAVESPPVFLTAYQLSKRWNWSIRPRTLSNWRGTGKGPKFVKLGGGPTVVYRLEDVEAFERESQGAK